MAPPVLHHEIMNRRTAMVAVVTSALTLAACGSDDEATPTSVEVTLFTTTSTTEPVFVPSDPESDEVGDIDEAPPSSDAAPATDDEPVDSIEATEDEPVVTEPEADQPPTSDAPPSGDGGAVDLSTFSLTVDGLGVTAFGAEPEGAISFVSSFFGEPTADTGWIDPFEVGACSGTTIRQVDWGQLRLEFGDVSDVTQGREHFYAYTYGVEGSLGSATPPGLTTPLGLTVGSTVGDLIEAHPSTQLFSADEFLPASFVVNANFTGRLSGLADDDVVEVIIGGIPCVI